MTRCHDSLRLAFTLVQGPSRKGLEFFERLQDKAVLILGLRCHRLELLHVAVPAMR